MGVKGKKKGLMAIAILIGVVVITLMLILAGNRKVTFTNEDPNSRHSGFYSSTQTYHGGDSRLDKKVNVGFIEIENYEDQDVIRLYFAKGSQAADGNVKDLSGVPEYEIFCLQDPGRIVVKLHNVTFWDYENTFEALNYDGIVKDVFRPYTSSLSDKDAQDIYLYFQVNTDMAFMPSEDENCLEIAVKTVDSDLGEKAYYAISSLYYDWEKMIDKIELYPTYTDDYTKQLLISKPFATEKEAKDFIASVTPKFEELNLENDLTVKMLKKGELPEYEASADTMFVNNVVAKKDGREKTLPLLMPYCQYICSSPNGSNMLLSRNALYIVGEEINYSVELYLAQMSGKATVLNIPGIPTVDKAAFNADGSKIAILNNTTDYTLNVYNVNTGETINLGEEGIGNMVASFAWNDNGNMLHIVAGDNGAFQMKTYDFSKPVGKRITVLNESFLESEGSFEYIKGKLYYLEQVAIDKGYEGTIYTVNESNGNLDKVTDGIACQFSQDGKYMAVKDITDYSAFSGDEFAEGAKVYGLKIIELGSGKETRVLENEDFGNFVWSYDSAKLYFAKNVMSEVDDEYIYELNRYSPSTKETEKIVNLKSDAFYTTKESNTLLVTDFVSSHYATYILDINNISK